MALVAFELGIFCGIQKFKVVTIKNVNIATRDTTDTDQADIEYLQLNGSLRVCATLAHVGIPVESVRSLWSSSWLVSASARAYPS